MQRKGNILTFVLPVIVISFVAAFQLPAYGRVLFVDVNSVAGTEDGTPLAPYKTIVNAVAGSAEGDVLLIQPGQYPLDPATLPIILNHSLGFVGMGQGPDILYNEGGSADIFRVPDLTTLNFLTFENLHFVGPWDYRTLSTLGATLKEFTLNNCRLDEGGHVDARGTPDGRAIISNNSYQGHYDEWWGFVDAKLFSECTIFNNQIDKSRYAIEPGCTNNIVDSNTITNSRQGLAIAHPAATTALVMNNIIQNSLQTGIRAGTSASGVLQLINNTIEGTNGDGIYITSMDGTVDLINNISFSNIGYGVNFLDATGITSLTITNNNVFGVDTLGNYNGISDPTSTNGNISADPSLDATGHLLAGSICVDAGTDTSVYGVFEDIDGDPRVVPYDIGADELLCNPTSNKEKGPKCSDGIDNDCDGLIDGADPDC